MGKNSEIHIEKGRQRFEKINKDLSVFNNLKCKCWYTDRHIGGV